MIWLLLLGLVLSEFLTECGEDFCALVSQGREPGSQDPL